MPDNKSKRRVIYINPPTECDICHGQFKNDCFYDARTVQGCWANMCMECFHNYGVGLGTGFGQEYQKDGVEWIKTRG